MRLAEVNTATRAAFRDLSSTQSYQLGSRFLGSVLSIVKMQFPELV